MGETDVPDSLPEFIMQRRRWLNGSLFAAVYALAHLPQMVSGCAVGLQPPSEVVHQSQLRSGHGAFRKSVLVFEAFFNVLALIFAWFGVVSILSPGYRGGLVSDDHCYIAGELLSILLKAASYSPFHSTADVLTSTGDLDHGYRGSNLQNPVHSLLQLHISCKW